MDNEKKTVSCEDGDRVRAYYDLGKRVVDDRPKRERRTAEKRDMIFALLCLAVSVASAYLLMFSGVGLGVSLSSLLILALTFIYVSKEKKKGSAYTYICAALYSSLAVSMSLSDSGFPKFLGVCMMFLLYTVIILDLRGLRVHEAGTYRSVGDVCFAAFGLPFSAFGDTCHALTHETDGAKMKMRKAGSVLIGVLFAIPVLCIVVPLLVSSDAAFEAVLSRITFNNVWDIVWSLIIGTLAFVLWFGQLFYSRWEKRGEPKRARSGSVESAVLSSFLVVISLVYVIYLLSQTAYFTGGFSGILPEGFTAADYARRGFFELCVICALNLLFVFGVWVLEKKEGERGSGLICALCTFLCGFSMFLCSTALSKMFMYIGRFGLTRLRIYTSVFMVLLFVVFFAVILRIYVRKTPYMKAAIITAAILTALMCMVDVDGAVAKYNTEAYLEGRTESVDTNSLGDLSSDAVVPYLFELLEDDKYTARVKEILSERADVHFDVSCDEESGEWYIEDSAYSFGRYNIHEYKAHKMLLERFEEYYEGLDVRYSEGD